MSFLTENWFFIAVALACIGMHFFGHGHGHGHGQDHGRDSQPRGDHHGHGPGAGHEGAETPGRREGP